MVAETWSDLFAFLLTLMTSHASMFETLGTNLFRGFAVILIVWFGVKSALASASGGHSGFQFDRFAGLLMTIAFGDAMITYYSRPIPGLGFSFYHLIVDQGTNLASELNHGIVTELTNRLNSIYYETEQPGLSLALNSLELLRYAITFLALEAAEIASFRRDRIWVRGIRHRSDARADLYPILYCSKIGVVVLGLAKIVSAICFLSRGGKRLHFRIWAVAHSLRGFPSAALRRGCSCSSFHAIVFLIGGVHLGSTTDPVAGELLVCWPLGRVGRARPARRTGEMTLNVRQTTCAAAPGRTSLVRAALR